MEADDDMTTRRGLSGSSWIALCAVLALGAAASTERAHGQQPATPAPARFEKTVLACEAADKVTPPHHAGYWCG
jgi:hypothetical protein